MQACSTPTILPHNPAAQVHVNQNLVTETRAPHSAPFTTQNNGSDDYEALQMIFDVKTEVIRCWLL